MHSTPPHSARSTADSDAALRSALRQTLQSQAVQTPEAEHAALQARVMAQWQQRHPQAQLALVGASQAGWRLGGVPKGWLAAALALALVVALTAWFNRPDPVLEELMQPDVLSQIALGEM